MTAHFQSGHSIGPKSAKLNGRFRPEADTTPLSRC
jgi:hypothetical protein